VEFKFIQEKIASFQKVKGGVDMKIQNVILALFFAYSVIASYGCVTSGQPSAKVTHAQGQSVMEAQMESYDGPRARIAVGDFQVKASRATYEIGDGLREMLVTSLYNCNRFIVLDRQAMQDILLEQDLGASGRLKEATAAPTGELEGAEILVYGVVTEFEMDKSGTGINFGISNLPLTFGGGMSNAHMAIDLRAVDTATGRVVCATRVEGEAADFDTRVGVMLGDDDAKMPISLGTYSNTPMEKAIRVTIDKAVEYLSSNTPNQYFHHK
jgi:curli biogenesis system outer membrane secretion channel CsgG